MSDHVTVQIGNAVVEKSGMAGTVSGAAMAAAGSFTLNDLLAIGGFMLALVSVLFQVWATWFFKTRHLKIAEARLAADLKGAGGDDGDA